MKKHGSEKYTEDVDHIINWSNLELDHCVIVCAHYDHWLLLQQIAWIIKYYIVLCILNVFVFSLTFSHNE